jgi:alpha-tubulin suppressor-like RCC1 family protein
MRRNSVCSAWALQCKLQGVRCERRSASRGCVWRVGCDHTLAPADDGSVYAWGHEEAAKSGALGLATSVQEAGRAVFTPQRVPALHVAYGL